MMDNKNKFVNLENLLNEGERRWKEAYNQKQRERRNSKAKELELESYNQRRRYGRYCKRNGKISIEEFLKSKEINSK